MANYQYKLTSTGQSSQTYGNCEVCEKHVSEVFYQVESVEYEPGKFTYYECRNYFGHKDCLLSVRRPTKRATDALPCGHNAGVEFGESSWSCVECGQPVRR